ncbi:protein-tyrosine-phosphatase [Aquirufa nivalisilvae]|uniref:arsenate reductase/protein-tyrosine-phosphatase family protein n=1 Tax=Aquirufa nivalisilvae TaxID=2516557 RepID=UPI0022A9A823|nr:protein-tyrosine-phosphatase [Aquirufa nivalisilvae]
MVKNYLLLAFMLFFGIAKASTNENQPTTLVNYIQSIKGEVNLIPNDRKIEIEKLANYVKGQIQANKPVNLVFICTHNSRRSQMSQIWASVAIDYFQLVGKISTYSGGTETTAFNSRAVSALERAGISIDKPTGTNPHYQVKYSDKLPSIECFSKVYTNPFNPQTNFVAVMNCSDADKNCPNVKGASFRTAIKYDDPKLSDGTPEEQRTYDSRCRQIATEMFYLMSLVGKADR